MRGKFSPCVAYRLNHWSSTYGFDQGLELCTCAAMKFIEQFHYTIILKLCIIILFLMNFVPNMHYKDVSLTLAIMQICLEFKSRKVATEIRRRVHISLLERKFGWER